MSLQSWSGIHDSIGGHWVFRSKSHVFSFHLAFPRDLKSVCRLYSLLPLVRLLLRGTNASHTLPPHPLWITPGHALLDRALALPALQRQANLTLRVQVSCLRPIAWRCPPVLANRRVCRCRR